NGKPTSYHFFDGYSYASTAGKVAYVTCAVLGLFFYLLPLAVPILMEVHQKHKAEENADDARAAIQREGHSSQSQVPVYEQGRGMAMEVNEQQQAASRFRENLATQPTSDAIQR